MMASEDDRELDDLLAGLREAQARREAPLDEAPLEGDPELAARLMAPLGDAAAVKTADAALAALAEAPTAQDERADLAEVVPLRPRWRRWVGAGAGVALAAAAAVLLVMSGPSAEPLPSYEMSWKGGAKVVRSGDTRWTPASEAAPVLREGDRLELALRPSVKVEGEIGARVVATRGDATRELQPEVRVSPDGALRLQLEGLGAGTWTLAVEIARAGGETEQTLSLSVQVEAAE